MTCVHARRVRMPTRVPCLPLGCDFDVRQTPFTHREYRKDPDKMLALWKLIVAKFDYDWALLFPDDLIEWEFTGIETTDDEWIPPGTMKYLSATRETLELLRLPEPATDGRMPLHLRGLRLIKEHFQGSVCVTGRVAAPFSAVALVLGVEATLMLMLDDPPLIVKLRSGFSSGTILPRHCLGRGIAILGAGRGSAGSLMRWH